MKELRREKRIRPKSIVRWEPREMCRSLEHCCCLPQKCVLIPINMDFGLAALQDRRLEVKFYGLSKVENFLDHFHAKLELLRGKVNPCLLTPKR